MSFIKKTTIILSLGAIVLGFWLYASIFSDKTSASGRVKGVSTNAVVVYDDEDKIIGKSGNTKEEAILSDLGIVVYPEDKVSCFPDPALGLGTTFQIERATLVCLKDANNSYQVRTWQETVEGLLKEEGIKLSGKDKVEPVKSTILKQEIQVTVTRIGIKREEKREILYYDTVRKPDSNLLKGKSYVDQKGKNGEKILTYEKTFINGRISSNKLIKEEIAEPTSKIVVYGTKIPVLATQYGTASWYPTSGFVAAHRDWKKGSKVRVTYRGKSIVVTIAGWGPSNRGRIIDLSRSAAYALGITGIGYVKIELLG